MFAIRPTYLIMVTAENNNKYYNCFPEGDNFRVEYGRVIARKQQQVILCQNGNLKFQAKLKRVIKM